MQQNFDNALFCQFNIMGHNKMGVQRSTQKNKQVIQIYFLIIVKTMLNKVFYILPTP